MLDTTNLTVSALIVHAGINPETQRELQLDIMRVLNNAPAGVTYCQKQLALIIVLEELLKGLPVDHQPPALLAVVATVLLGARLLIGVSVKPNVDPDSLI